MNNYFYDSDDSDYEEQDDMEDSDYEPEDTEAEPEDAEAEPEDAEEEDVEDNDEDEGSIYEPETDSDYEDEDEYNVYDPEKVSTINIYTINKYDKHGLTPLMRAVIRRDLKLVKIILSLPGVDINMFSSVKHHIRLRKYELQGMFEYTALGFAIYSGYDDIANALLATPGINISKVRIFAGSKYK
jgi:ankyrin repeat protein